jgi:hypothetical protein
MIDLSCSATGSQLATPQITVPAGKVSFLLSAEQISYPAAALPAGTTLSATLQNSNTLVSNPVS